MSFSLRVLVLMAALAAATGCPRAPGGQCSPSSCAGCCDAAGVCQLGLADAACGARGALCTVCGLGMSCGSGVCLPGSTGGSGGSGGAGGSGGWSGGTGGSGGGVVAHSDRELISGSRLRAVNFIGSDGSRAPFTISFYDTQLQTYCLPSAYAYSGLQFGLLVQPACMPFPLLSVGGDLYDSTCQTQLVEDTTSAYTALYGAALAGLPPLAAKYAVRVGDGGVEIRPISPFQGTLGVKLSDGGCGPVPAGQSHGPTYAPSGGPVPVSSFVAMPTAME